MSMFLLFFPQCGSSVIVKYTNVWALIHFKDGKGRTQCFQHDPVIESSGCLSYMSFYTGLFYVLGLILEFNVESLLCASF